MYTVKFSLEIESHRVVVGFITTCAINVYQLPIKLNMCERTISQLPVVTSKEVLQTKEYLKQVHLTRSSFGQQ